MKQVILKEELYSPLTWDRKLQQLELNYYNQTATQQWAEQFWPWIFGLSFAYVALCFIGVRWMRDRPKFQLRRPLVLWNAGLAAYSIFGLWRMIPAYIDDLSDGRYSDIACSTDYFTTIGVWCFLFPFSKVFEFGDTLFVVLKKKKLIFLHWYHHITVLWFCWYSYVIPIGPGRMFSGVNLFVHSIMYTYYGIVASGLVRLPRWINIAVTTLQISQMFVGMAVSSYAYYSVQNGVAGCVMYQSHFILAMLMYTSYMILFGNYFFMTYIRKKPVSSTQQTAMALDKASNSAAGKHSNGANGTSVNGNGVGGSRTSVNGVNGNSVHSTNGHHGKVE